MQVILQKTVPNVGLVGDIVNVSPGYYRNFLSPRSLALIADSQSVKRWEHQKKVVETRTKKEKAKAFDLKSKIEAAPVELSHQAGAGEKLFGSITNQEIAMALREKGFEIDRKQLINENPLKTLGEHVIEVKLHPEVTAQIKVIVSKKE